MTEITTREPQVLTTIEYTVEKGDTLSGIAKEVLDDQFHTDTKLAYAGKVGESLAVQLGIELLDAEQWLSEDFAKLSTVDQICELEANAKRFGDNCEEVLKKIKYARIDVGEKFYITVYENQGLAISREDPNQQPKTFEELVAEILPPEEEKPVVQVEENKNTEVDYANLNIYAEYDDLENDNSALAQLPEAEFPGYVIKPIEEGSPWGEIIEHGLAPDSYSDVSFACSSFVFDDRISQEESSDREIKKGTETWYFAPGSIALDLSAREYQRDTVKRAKDSKACSELDVKNLRAELTETRVAIREMGTY